MKCCIGHEAPSIIISHLSPQSSKLNPYFLFQRISNPFAIGHITTFKLLYAFQNAILSLNPKIKRIFFICCKKSGNVEVVSSKSCHMKDNCLS
jgi:hypothetical protein